MSLRPDACPGVFALHDAADGALARVRLPGGAIDAAALRVLAGCAEELGDGAVHLTSRGNVQLRGLRRDDPRLADRLTAAGLLPSATHERARNVLASPLSGIVGGLADVRDLARELDRELCARPALAALSGRFLFALDDGRGDVAAEDPDLCWQAVGPCQRGDTADAQRPQGDIPATGRPADGVLRVAGEPVARVTQTRAVAALLDAAEAFLASSDGAWRARPAAGEPAAAGPAGAAPACGPGEGTHRATPAPVREPGGAPRGWLGGATVPADGPGDEGSPPTPAPVDGPSDDGRAHVPADGPGGEASPPTPAPVGGPSDYGRAHAPAARPGGPPLGWVGGGAALVCAPVLGEMSAAQLRVLAAAAPHVVVTPWRTVVLPGARAGADARLAAAGFVVDPASPVPLVSACAGRPGCAKALADVRADARAGLAAGRFTERVHLSGCARRCGSPRAPHRALVAHAEGQYAG